jgi:hypothetical protein
VSCPGNAFAPNGSSCGFRWSQHGCGPINVDYCSGGSCTTRGDFSGGEPSCGAVGGLCGFSSQCCDPPFYCVSPGPPIYNTSDCAQCCRSGSCCRNGDPLDTCI